MGLLATANVSKLETCRKKKMQTLLDFFFFFFSLSFYEREERNSFAHPYWKGLKNVIACHQF